MVSQGLVVPQATGIAQCLARLAAGKSRCRPLATYRLQFHNGFRFDDARAVRLIESP
jgi:hypothetical protein